jgi:hypothetical protein
MTRLKLLVSSLLVSASLSACANAQARTTADKPVTADVAVKLDRAKVRAALAARRKVVIERFLAYREARVYPWNNSFMPTPAHLWFDIRGNLCAAATLISYDWGKPSTMKVGVDNRGIMLSKVTKGEVADWMLTSGLTHHEIVAIQAPAVGVDDEQMRGAEIERLYALYTDVERQLDTLAEESLDQATDALMKRPALAKKFLAGKLPGPGKFQAKQDDVFPINPLPPAPEEAPTPEPSAPPVAS